MLPTMDPLPPEVARRIESLAGGAAMLVFDAFAPEEGRAVVYLAKPGQLPMHVIVHGVHDASWGFAGVPSLRVPWRFHSPVRSIRLAVVQLYDPTGGSLTGGSESQGRREPLANRVRPAPPIRGVAVTGTALGAALYGPPVVPAPMLPPADRAVRLEVQFEGDAPLVFEGHGVTLGPIPPPGRTLTAASTDERDLEALPPLPAWGPRGPVKPS